ncbi:MAG: hypothetical protein A2854_00250 [Parcubacteria group bacterium RIFCSPHIGHO2_01_FULL_56_18]|nr:MAG: hypothetical protein A2854_00250 [Parcubacteria group bacterium RIFCSPHIGHO2_01_FULL_56_18]
MPKHFFFDLDNTLTASRRRIEPAHAELFGKLCEAADVIVVTGGTAVHIREQLTPAFEGRYLLLAQSGNHAIDKNGTELWYGPFSADQVAATLSCIEILKKSFGLTVKDENDLIDNRGAQISYSVIGYHEDPAKKDAFDPDFSKRRAMLDRFPKEIAALAKVGVEVFPAGSSGYNFTIIGKDKGANVGRLVSLKGWDKDECIYIGDALGPGENDASVIGVIPTKSVKDYHETYEYLSSILV